ncbi:MAG: S41 family peptidase [Calditrichia bacterium]|nr:S41 family peptidase [Calditrichia bacterium]
MKQHIILVTLLSLILIITPVHITTADETDFYKKVQKGLTNFEKVYKQINMHYVEEFDPYEFIRAGIDGMLNKLDPYTVFIEPEADINLKIITTGKYGGLGMEIGMRNKKVTVISPMDNSPAKRAGIRAGDIIEKINGILVSSLSTQKVSTLLRGPIGTDVELSISRNGYTGEISMKITRAEILIEDVNYSDFIENNIAYVRLTGFTDKAEEELINAINDLKDKHKIEGFILDLRGNSGGLLESAVEVSNVFLPQNTLVVSTKGYRDGDHEFKTTSNPILPDVPMVVLVDGGSASASEIVAGALQDIDRAIILGSETFGKGLVQKVYNIDNSINTKLKITTAKYYIPSGRCIQKYDYTKENGVFATKDSSISDDAPPHEFYTINKRKVFEKGGISPDVDIKDSDLSNLAFELYRQSVFFNFSVKYQQDNPNWSGEFKINDQILNEFFAYANDIEFSYEIEGEENLEKFIEIAEKNSIREDLIISAKILLDSLQNYKNNDIVNHREEIRNALLAELADKYFTNHKRIKYSLINDLQLNSALEVLNNKTEYKKILAIN